MGYALRHLNAKGLGRDLPLGLWLANSGHILNLAPGRPTYDWLED